MSVSIRAAAASPRVASNDSFKSLFLTTSVSSPGNTFLLLPVVTNFIMKAFINGRKLFGTPFYPVPSTEVVGQL